MFHGRKFAATVVVAALVMAASGIAIASIPDAEGTVHLCYSVDGKGQPSDGVRVIEPGLPGNSGACKKNERSLDVPGPELPTACADGQVAKFTAGTNGWESADDIDTDTDTDTDTTYSAGEGLHQEGTTFAADFGVVQRRVNDACGGGSTFTQIHPDGTADCTRTTDPRVVAPGLQRLAPGEQRVLADVGAFRVVANCTVTDAAMVLRHVSGIGVNVVADNRTTKVGQTLTSGEVMLGRSTSAAPINRGNFNAADRSSGKTLDGSFSVVIAGGACEYVFSAIASS